MRGVGTDRKDRSRDERMHRFHPAVEHFREAGDIRNIANRDPGIAEQADEYARRLGAWTDADFRKEVDMFGRKSSRGLLIVTLVLNGHAAYRTQLFLYLKACGREELSTMNLWAGMDAPPPAH